MTESDVLARAAKALRSAHTGQREGSGFTRARIMTRLHQKRRGSVFRWAILSPLAALALVGSAWAHGTGKWPVVWRAVTSVFVSASNEAGSGARSHVPEEGATREEREDIGERPDTPTPETPPSPVLAPAEIATTNPDDTARPDVEIGSSEVSRTSRQPVSRQRPPSRAKPRALGARAAERRPEPESDARKPTFGATDTAADPELSRFRAAHDVHFQGDRPREAIAAYTAYLDEFPSGRFVPEARYNMAVSWIKLGDKARARAALAPFAEGTYGNYRREEARQLLDALR